MKFDTTRFYFLIKDDTVSIGNPSTSIRGLEIPVESPSEEARKKIRFLLNPDDFEDMLAKNSTPTKHKLQS